ncbi:MAG: MarR family transcriptional regulator [Ferruginibacter sp.]|nr:MarR family transcriptional regulator [Ferruginibacter sp.]
MDQLYLQNQLCFPLYALSRQMTALYKPHLKKLELTYPQYLVMLLLWEHKNLSVKQIGCELWLDSGTLTPMLKRMEETGLLTRHRSTEDERVVNIHPTKEGRLLQKKAIGIPENIFSELSISHSELKSLKKELSAMLKSLEKK